MIRFPLMAMAAASILVSACATTPSDMPQALYTAEAAFTEATTLAAQYVQLPECTPMVVGALCSDPATSRAMVAAANKASTLILQAQQTISVGGTAEQQAVEAAVAAVNALTALTQNVKVS